jgi:hypothetical protein
MREHFIEGIGYVFYGNDKEDGQIKRGWWVRFTQDGKIGASFPPKYFGKNKEEAAFNSNNEKLQKFFKGIH